MERKKIMLFGAAMAALYYATNGKDKKSSCSSGTFFKVGNQTVCDSDLVDLGYIYWRNGVLGSGWYKMTAFNNAFNMPLETFETTLKNAAQNTMDPNGANYANAQSVLNTYYIAGNPILVQV